MVLSDAKREQYVQLVAKGKSPVFAYACVGHPKAKARQCAARLLRNANVSARFRKLEEAIAQGGGGGRDPPALRARGLVRQAVVLPAPSARGDERRRLLPAAARFRARGARATRARNCRCRRNPPPIRAPRARAQTGVRQALAARNAERQLVRLLQNVDVSARIKKLKEQIAESIVAAEIRRCSWRMLQLQGLLRVDR